MFRLQLLTRCVDGLLSNGVARVVGSDCESVAVCRELDSERWIGIEVALTTRALWVRDVCDAASENKYFSGWDEGGLDSKRFLYDGRCFEILEMLLGDK